MRSAIVTREWPPEVYGGAGVHVTELVAALKHLIDVDVYCMGAPRNDAWSVALPPAEQFDPALGVLQADIAIAQEISRAKPDLVHSHTWYANFAGHIAAKNLGVPHLITAHSLEPRRPWKAEQLGGGYALSSFAERTALEAADAIVADLLSMTADRATLLITHRLAGLQSVDEVLVLDREHFQLYVLAQARIVTKLLRELSKRLRAADQAIENLALGSVHDRIFHLLGHLGRHAPERHLHVGVDVGVVHVRQEAALAEARQRAPDELRVERAGLGEPGHAQRVDRAFGTARQHDVGIAVLDGAHRDADVRSRSRHVSIAREGRSGPRRVRARRDLARADDRGRRAPSPARPGLRASGRRS